MAQDKQSRRERLADLSPEQRERLERLLKERVSKPLPLRRRDPAESVPLTFGQQELWILDRLNPGNPAYNETNSMRFKFAVDMNALESALNEIVRRHEILRTVIRETSGDAVQSVKLSLHLSIAVHDLRRLSPASREGEALRMAAEQSRVPFDLTVGPLIRASIYRIDSGDSLFVLTLHHLVCDGWSMGVLSIELITLYWSFVAGVPSPLPELPLQYGDFAVWQHQSFRAIDFAPQLMYWRKQLAGLRTLDLPLDHPRPARFTFNGARQPVPVSGSLYAALKSLSQSENTTVCNLLLAAFYVLLHRYAGQDDVAVGCPVAGRNHKHLGPLVGFFVNTLVMRVSLRGKPTFLELLSRVRDLTSGAYANQDLPFEKLVDALRPPRDSSRNPLFQVMFQLFQPITNGLEKAALIPFLPVESGISKVDLSLDLLSTENELRGHIEYNTDLFERPRIERMAGHFNRLLHAIVEDPSCCISDLPMLTADEQRGILAGCNQTRTGYPREANIPELFEEQVSAHPDQIAVTFEGGTLTYAELNRNANALASTLRRNGVRPGSRVALLIDRCIEVPQTLLAILKCGAAFAPIDPGWPKERIDLILSDCAPSVVVAAARDSTGATGFAGKIIVLGDTMEGVETEVPDVNLHATDLAYVMYTSGTTGAPKGVAVTHRNIIRLVKDVSYIKLDNSQTVLQFAPLSFDASTFEIWGSLLNGGRLAMHPAGTPSLAELGACIKREGVTTLFLTTSLFRQMVESCAEDLRGVKQILAGGEAMPVTLAKAAWKSLPRSRICNVYGPTECTTFATAYPIANPEAIGDSVPIGRPIENTTAYILDEYGNLVPIGVPGELYLGGDGVALGYWKRPELTEASFVPDRFTGAPYARLYRTGDVARYAEDGNIVFCGRRDRQIKFSGYRIELGEIEAEIRRHPDVSECAVLVSSTGDRLVAFLELRPSCSFAVSALRGFLNRRLPAYMLPAQFEILPQLPLNSNGKTDFAALAEYEAPSTTRSAEFVAPANPIEETLHAQWRDLLQTERVGVYDNFFELGGQSLVAMRLLSRIRETFQAEVSMREFFDNPTISGLAAILMRDQRAAFVGTAHS